jgi:hypothetical protein
MSNVVEKEDESSGLSALTNFQARATTELRRLSAVDEFSRRGAMQMAR